MAAAKPPVGPNEFSMPLMVNDNKANIQAGPVIVPMPGNKVFVAWRDSRSGDDDIYTSSSADGGSSFSMNRRADDSTTASKQIAPSSAVTGSGTVLLAWQDNRRSTFDYDIYFTKSSDGGTTFAKNVKVDDSASNVISWQERPSIAVTGSGTIFVAWTDDRTGVLRVRGAYSTDGGLTFSPSREFASNGANSGQTGVALVASGERIYAAFVDNVTGSPHAYVCVSNDAGRTFGVPFRLDGSGSGALQRDISIAAMPAGGIVAVWDDSRNGNWDIYASILRNDGTVLARDLRVDDDATGQYQMDPYVTVDRAGTVYVVWDDERDLKFAIRFAYLKVGSTTFTPSVEIATPRADTSQRKATIMCAEPGRVSVVWQDDRAGTYDVYSSVGYFPNLFDLKLVKGWNFATVPLVGWGYKASTLGLKTGDVVVGWNSATATYDRMYIVGVSPLTKDFAISPGEGYWISAVAAETLSLNGDVPGTPQRITITVPSGGGWAVVGFASLWTYMRASNIPSMFSVSNGVLAVSTFNPATGLYKIYIPGLPTTDFALVPGQAYSVWCTQSGTLTYIP